MPQRVLSEIDALIGKIATQDNRQEVLEHVKALHELVHWTAPASPCNREFGRRFGDSAYAVEELVAEMGSAFLSAHCRLDGRLQHAE